MSDDDSDFKFSNLRQRFESQKENEILKPKAPPKPNLVLIRKESTRTPPQLLERRRALEVKSYREIVSNSISDNTDESEDEPATLPQNADSYDLTAPVVKPSTEERHPARKISDNELPSRDTSIAYRKISDSGLLLRDTPSGVSRKIFEASSFLYKSGSVLSNSTIPKSPKLPPKKPNPPPKPSFKIYASPFPIESDAVEIAESGDAAIAELNNRSSFESFDSFSDEFEDCSDTDLKQSNEGPTLNSTEEIDTNNETSQPEALTQQESEISEVETEVKSIPKTPRVIQEILESEQIYIANLKRGIDEYIAPFDSVSLPSSLVGKKRILFSNIEVIYRLHESRFYPSLCESGFDPEKVADVFSSFIDGFDFDVYIVYILNRNKSDKLCREHEDFFKDLQRDKLGIGSFLTQPIQRLPKYQLLIGAMVKDLMKDLDENKSAIAACCRAEKHIQRLLNTVNEYC